MELLNAEFPDGPLTPYRAKATFDWRELKVFLEGEDSIRFKHRIYKALSMDPLFHRDWRSLSLRESREINYHRWKRIQEYAFLDSHQSLQSNVDRMSDLCSVLEAYDQGLAARYSLSSVVFLSCVLMIGTQRHLPIVEQCLNNKIVGCLCLTELSHGSNTKSIRTECHFNNGEFIMQTPDEEAVKCWAGNLSHSATHAVVFAQLYVEGACKGVHAFCIQVRNISSMRPLLGITIGDMGEKTGVWNGVENGWMRFNSHRIPLSALLNRFADVTSDGIYITTSKDSRQRHSATVGVLALGRVGIVGKGALAAQLAAVIAIRYSAIRKQSGPKGKDELPILEYPMQQHRLFPIISTAIALSIFHRQFHRLFYECLFSKAAGNKSVETAAVGREIHALSSATKALATFAGVKCLSEARLACGGHGFLKCSRLNDLRDDFDPSQTFEGENNVLLQQASATILSILDGKHPSPDTPFGSFCFLRRPPSAFIAWHDDIVTDVEKAYEWLVFHLASHVHRTVAKNEEVGMGRLEARSNAQFEYCRSLAMAYGELTVISWFHQAALRSPHSIRNVLRCLSTIYALSTLEKHIATFYIGGYCSGAEWGRMMRESLFEAEATLKCDAVAICDAIAPPDFVLHSALGMSDGRVYEHLSKEFEKNIAPPPPWCTELAAFLLESKL
ncbi:Peroxisomal acyl-coenzyme A oxidase 3 [Toxocara canis]|uniref:Acyl-coenzyme A oxidase n=2 Tax=Toxocara canis TaxID=6265 RepID=A0A0B2W0I3_TOXCA|nr:Peroxisomal acyl-coenzyme A oxidase 3 [Toxocara canis]VDM36952.1 unnamed protein product [Toxocara canis]